MGSRRSPCSMASPHVTPLGPGGAPALCSPSPALHPLSPAPPFPPLFCSPPSLTNPGAARACTRHPVVTLWAQARDPHFPTRHAEAGGRHVPRARDPLPRGDFRPATCGPPPVLWRPELDLECQVHVSCFLAWSGEGPRSQGFGGPQAQQAKATSPFISKLALDILGPLRDHGMGDP